MICFWISASHAQWFMLQVLRGRRRRNSSRPLFATQTCRQDQKADTTVASPTTRGAQGARRGRGADLLRERRTSDEDYFTFEWILLFASFVVIGLIYFLFTPYTHQLDEIKNTFLWTLTPFLFAAVVLGAPLARMSWRTHASTFLFGGFVLSILISWLVNPQKAVGERVVWFQLACATFTVIFAWFMNSESKMRKTMMFFVLVCLGAVTLGLLMFGNLGFPAMVYEHARKAKWGPEWITLFYTLKESKEMYSTILNPDFFAAFLIMTLTFPLAMFFVEEHVTFKVLAVTTFLLMLVCLFFTNSNDSFMALILSAIVFLVLSISHIRQMISRRVLITFIVGLLFLGATIFILMLPQLSRTWEFKAAALEGRKILWSGGFWPWLYQDDYTRSNIDIVSFLFGTGPGGYRFYFPFFRRADFFDNQINNVTTFSHNYYIDILCEFGLVGFLLFMGFYGKVLWDGVRQVFTTSNPSHRYYQIACITGLIGISLQNFFSPNNRWAVCATIFFCLFGLSMGIHHLDRPGKTNLKDSDRPLAPIFRIALGILAVLFIFRSAPQGIRYFDAAMYNANGLKYMEIADEYSDTHPQQAQDLLERARIDFESAIKINPTFATTYYKLAHVYNQLGDMEKAIETYERLEQINPNYSEIHLNLGIMYSTYADALEGEERFKFLEKAYKEMREAARQEVKPNVQWIAGIIGEHYAREIMEQGKAGTLAPKADVGAGTSMSEAQQAAFAIYDEVKKYYRTVLDYEPKLPEYVAERKEYYPRAMQKLLTICYMTEDDACTEEILKRMYAEDPNNKDALTALLAFLERKVSVEKKLEFLEMASHNDPVNAAMRKTLAQAYRDAGEMDKYVAELKRIQALEPEDYPAAASLYLALQQQGKQQEAAAIAARLNEAGVDPEQFSTGTLSGYSITSPPQLIKRIERTSDTLVTTEGELVPATSTLATTAVDTRTSR
jgi:tetratricopeptide (TPR) repeat protein